jgi:hypothetical protein
MTVLVDEIRAACAAVAARARHVQIQADRVADYAANLPPGPPSSPGAEPAGRERTAAFWLTLDAINFGSGWFPTLRKRPGASGYATVAGGLRERFEAIGAWRASQLAQIDSNQIAQTLGQDPEHELMALFAASLRDLGERVAGDHGGSFSAVIDVADGSAVALAELLTSWTCFADTSRYRELEVPFFKRAQIAAADLHRSRAAHFGDLDRLTMFADNLVPHVLRLDGVLHFEPQLVARIDREELIAHGSTAEVEIRACALHAVELIVAARPGSTAAQLDELLWHRGGQAAYKAFPRHRSRCTAY